MTDRLIDRQPISLIRWTDPADLHPNPWNPNRVHRAELRLLEHSLLSTGWIQPVLANPSGLIIDGFHRWRLAQDAPAVLNMTGGLIPVATLDLSDTEAMMMTVRINRAKGTHVAYEMSRIVHGLLESGISVPEVMQGIGATRQEVELLAADGVFDRLDTKNHAYSQAWYPVEVARAPREEETA